MADAVNRRRQSNRLQSRAPASILVNRPTTEWNVAIPLLSPLASSPPPNLIHRTVEIESRVDPTPAPAQTTSSRADAQSKYKKWQAAPFRYEASPSLLGASCS